MTSWTRFWRGFWLCLLFGGAWMLLGCATKKDWNSRIGTFRFDDVVREMGPPQASVRLTDGSQVGDWLMYRGSRDVYWFPSYTGAEGRVMINAVPNRILRLTFDSSGVLVHKQLVYR